MLCPAMMTDQPPPPLEVTPMLAEMALVPHMLSGDGMQQMILVQVNPGEIFTIRTEDGQFRCIAGPAHVPMVSPNGTMPPIFVPPGYMSQLVEENGMRKVVVLPHEFHPSMPLPPHHVPPYLPPHPAMLHHHHIYPGEMPPHFIPQLPPPPVYSEQDIMCHSASMPLRDERAAKMQEQLRRRAKDRQLSAAAACSSAAARLSAEPSPPPSTAAAALHNGHSKGPSASPGPGRPRPSGRTRVSPPAAPRSPDAEVDTRKMSELLSSVHKPTVSGVTSRSAVLSWQQPPLPLKNGDAPLPLSYELALSRGGSEGDFTPVYLGKDTSCAVQDLRPATDYHVRVCASCRSVRGSPSEATGFTTERAAPDTPGPPWLMLRTKNSLSLQWKAPCDNGSKITGYLLEYDEGKQSTFREIYCGHAKQYKVIRLTPSTKYAFRLAAKNGIGMSSFSELLTCSTAGCAPAPPAPPRLAGASVSWLALEWSAPCGPSADGTYTYTLEMEEEGSGYGFKAKHNGDELSFTVKNLRRSTTYRFRLLAANPEGRSQPSVAVEFSTCPDKPSSPGQPAVKGRVLPTSLHVSWDAPKDDGGSEITQYVLEMCQSQSGSQWETVYSGPQREHACDGLIPGTWYTLRVYCHSAGGQSQASDCLSAQTAPVPPGPCQGLRPAGRAKPWEIPLTWEPPAQDGGAPVSQYAVEMAESAEAPRCPLYEGADTHCTASSLQPGHTYCFWAKAANQAGWGPFSELCETSTAPGPPEQCGPPELTVKTANSVLASWEVPACNGAEVSEFRLEWGAAEGSMTLTYCGPSLSYEVRGLVPATTYYCRVQAVNVAGAGLFGDIAMVTTSRSVPAAVRLVEEVGGETLPGPASSCLALRWEEPCCHGAEITGYNIDFGEQLPLSVGRINSFVVENLQPDTSYRVRVQAVNSVGAGPFSAALKARTRPLPPDPPALECVVPGPQSLKLKWGEGPSRPQLSGATQYCLHMQASADRLVCIYSGPCHTFKVQRLSEATLYHFSIQAHNESGVGPLSPLYSFSTTRSPPPQLRAPRIELLDWNRYEVTWEALQPMRGDPVVYSLQLLRGREVEQLYKGSGASYAWQCVAAGSDWRVRVSAGRQCQDGGELWGQHSPSAALPAPAPPEEARAEPGATAGHGAHPRKGGALTDEQFALLLLLGFATVAILFAVLIQYFVIK
ncbi:fibronectin type-III domain-containing protein 3A-like [Anguilla anguilla]|uniref:fibronectin type-III domain-containing protein 3A-like n=1 Tax=Anguilla anguilla TaxID=7936 RepID=UPI0015A7A7DC|nr:fibronectin type-III domain-containing protein 3A-like [Anguilla anguilla]XP_035265120.1 fibronectin type-III domain-containing protein 3A-like [Anguilla anguilla]